MQVVVSHAGGLLQRAESLQWGDAYDLCEGRACQHKDCAQVHLMQGVHVNPFSGHCNIQH